MLLITYYYYYYLLSDTFLSLYYSLSIAYHSLYLVGGKRGKKQYGNARLSGLQPFSAGRSDCDSVVADDEMGGQDMEDGSNGDVSGAVLCLMRLLMGVIMARRPRL